MSKWANEITRLTMTRVWLYQKRTHDDKSSRPKEISKYISLTDQTVKETINRWSCLRSSLGGAEAPGRFRWLLLEVESARKGEADTKPKE